MFSLEEIRARFRVYRTQILTQRERAPRNTCTRCQREGGTSDPAHSQRTSANDRRPRSGMHDSASNVSRGARRSAARPLRRAQWGVQMKRWLEGAAIKDSTTKAPIKGDSISPEHLRPTRGAPYQHRRGIYIHHSPEWGETSGDPKGPQNGPGSTPFGLEDGKSGHWTLKVSKCDRDNVSGATGLQARRSNCERTHHHPQQDHPPV